MCDESIHRLQSEDLAARVEENALHVLPTDFKATSVDAGDHVKAWLAGTNTAIPKLSQVDDTSLFVLGAGSVLLSEALAGERYDCGVCTAASAGGLLALFVPTVTTAFAVFEMVVRAALFNAVGVALLLLANVGRNLRRRADAGVARGPT